MTYAKLSKQRIDGAHLYSCSAANVPDSCRANMIVPVWLYERQSSKPLDDLRVRLRSGEALQQFLEDKSGSDDDIVSQQCVSEGLDLGLACFRVSTQRERPDARVDQQRHAQRERSAL